jgi:DNA/RNA-binding domain of Phe-tRNA-synthetase-like protein
MDLVVELMAPVVPGVHQVSLPLPLGELVTPDEVVALLVADALNPAHAPFCMDARTPTAVRSALRQWGYRPSGRGKPSSEYLRQAVLAGRAPRINFVVDACNVASLHSGLPISVVDGRALAMPCRIAVAAPGSRYVFNPAGQEIDVGGLPCLHDAVGPCANAVKDAQRTKTHAASRELVVVVWSAEEHADDVLRVRSWLGGVFGAVGATMEQVG